MGFQGSIPFPSVSQPLSSPILFLGRSGGDYCGGTEGMNLCLFVGPTTNIAVDEHLRLSGKAI